MRIPNIIKFVFAPALLLSLQSCFVAKDYVRPEVINEANYRTDQISTDSLTMGNISWKDLFTDAVLKSHIEESLQKNIDIRIALQQIEAARAYMKQGKAGYLPSLNVGAQAGRQILSGNSQFGSFGSLNQFELSGNLSWEADIWGKIRSNSRASEAAYLQSVAAHKAVKTELIANIASLYYQLLALDEQVRITQQTIENRETSLETIKALKQAGTVTEVGVLQTEAQLYRARAVLIDLESQIYFLENTFSILLGDSPHEVERTDLSLQDIAAPLEIGVPFLLLRNRPDVIEAEYNLINAFELTNVAKSEFYPSLRLSASGGFQSLDIETFLNANSLFANIVGSLTQPIFNRRQIKTQYEVALAQQEIAFLNFRRSLLVATREVSDAYFSFEAAEERIELKTEELNAYKLATTYSEELLDNGLVNYLEVLTARENSLNAQLELVNAKFNRLNAVVELYQALGGGWQ